MADSHPAAPPHPLPPHLQPDPMAAPLGGGDARVTPTTEELGLIARLFDHLQISGQTLLTQREGSPWLELDVAGERGDRVWHFAIWRYTCRVYRVDRTGAVEDDPIEF